MTEKATSTPLKKLEEQLTCAICLDLFTNPRTLPCLHSFCQQCMEGLPLVSHNPSTQPLKNEFSCPTCRSSTVLPEPGPGGFPAAFHLKNLKEVYNLMKKICDQQVICDNCTTADATGHCKECNQFLCQECVDMHKKWARFATHKLLSLADNATPASPVSLAKQNCSVHGNPLELFCKTCEDVVCRSCIAADHKGHDYSGADYYRRRCQKLEFDLNSVREKITAVINALAALTNRENEIKEQGEAIKEEIHVMVAELVDVLKQSERQLSREVDTIIDSKLKVLLEQKKSAETRLSQLKNCKEFVEQSLQTGNPQQVLMGEKQMTERMIHVTQEVNMEDYELTEEADVQLTKDGNIVDTLHHIGIVFTPTTLQQCKIQKIDPRQLTIKKEMVSFPISLKFHDASFLVVPLSSINCRVFPAGIPVNISVNTPVNLQVDDSITTTITATAHPGVYMIQCSPLNRGSYEVTIRVNNFQLESTLLVIPFNPCLSTITPIRTIALKKPWGVAVNGDNHLVVSEYSTNTVTVLDKDGMPVKSFGSKDVKFYCPRGVAVTPDNFILVVDDHKIQKINMDGSGIASVGRQGTGALEFYNPHGVTVSPTSGLIYVADRDNHRIKVLNSDLAFSHSFGSKGTAIGQFSYPYYVAVDGQGFLYVADTSNNRIQKFTSDEMFVTEFGIEGSGPGQLNRPTAIVIDVHNWVYISDCTNERISIFTTDGRFVRSFGGKGSSEGQFYNPHGLAFDSEGTFYVCDYYNRRLVVY